MWQLIALVVLIAAGIFFAVKKLGRGCSCCGTKGEDKENKKGE